MTTMLALAQGAISLADETGGFFQSLFGAGENSFFRFLWDHPIFIIFALMAMMGALVCAWTRHIVYAAFALGVSFLGVAGLYVLLLAPMLAMVQVLVYVGAVLVLVLFAVMMTGRPNAGHEQDYSRIQLTMAGLSTCAVFMLLVRVINMTNWQVGIKTAPDMGANSTTQIATMLLDKYLLPFEVVSVLLLAAVVGAVLIARREGDR